MSPPVTLSFENSTPLLDKSRLVNLTSHGPTLGDVAAQMLSEALRSLYPDLALDPDACMIGTPQWHEENDLVVAGLTRFESLSHTLVRLNLYNASANFITAEHFLTLEPDALNPRHLAVDIEEIGRLLNDYSPLLFVEYQERQLNFWNSENRSLPRWQELADTLRKALDVNEVQGWSVQECALARLIFTSADKNARPMQQGGFSRIQAGLIDIDTLENTKETHLLLGGALVICAQLEQRELVLMYTIESGYESFASMDELGASLPSRISEQLDGRPMQWRLFEPEGNIFDHMAWALIASQLDSIAAIGDSSSQSAPATLTAPVVPAEEQVQLDKLESSIPDWLHNASADDLAAYSKYITELGKLYRDPAFKQSKDLIEPIDRFAQRLMCEALIHDKHAEGAAILPLDELEITITNSFTAGDLTLPDLLDTYTRTLGEYALENTPPYRASLRFKTGEIVPAWLTVELLTSLAQKVDIGSVYPQLIKRRLLDDSQESKRHATLYRQQLRLLLPLAALESKVRSQNGLDETGYGYIRQVAGERFASSHQISICPLTLIPQHRLLSSTDTVTNMFIIGARDPDSGPCILYRPLFEPALLQFPSRQNLLYALHQPGELRDSVLAWLADRNLSFEYAQYVFPVGLPSPWLVIQQLSDPTLHMNGLGHVDFGIDEVKGDLFQTLFESNAQALVELADRQSMSNAEQRWLLLRECSWTLFNVTSNFLSGALGAAVWVWQSIEEIQQALDAHERGDRLGEWSSLGDILLTLGIILTHHATRHRQRVAGELKPQKHMAEYLPKTEIVPVGSRFEKQPLLDELPSQHCSSVEIGGSVPRRNPPELGRYLDGLKVKAPDLSHEDLTRLNEHPPYLYQLADKSYAQVRERWFEVRLDINGQVTICDPHDSTRSGPLLTGLKGLWYIDTRLRLRGGGRKSRIQQFRHANELRKQELESELRAFKEREKTLKTELMTAFDEKFKATEKTREATSYAYALKLEEAIGEYQKALEHIRDWRTKGGSVGYVYDTVRLTTELHKNIDQWYLMKVHAYIRITEPLRNGRPQDPPTLHRDYVATITQAIELGQQLGDKLSLAETSLEHLKPLGKAGVTNAAKLRAMLPQSTVLDFKANEIGMSHEPCMVETNEPSMNQARYQVGRIITDAADAAHDLTALIKTKTATLETADTLEQISRFVDTFNNADQRLQEVVENYPQHVKRPRVMHLRTLIEEFRQLAQARIDSLLLNDPTLRQQEAATSEQPGPSRAMVKVYKTRPRESAPDKPEKSTADPINKIVPDSRPALSPARSDIDIISDALELNLDCSNFLKNSRKDAQRPSRIPADMQEIHEQYARKLEQSATDVEQALSNLRAAKKSFPPIASLSTEMREAATRVRREGVDIRASMYKLRKPTQTNFKWMHENAQLSLARDERGRIPTKQFGDYFQEFRILDKANNDQPLWVAHFHYKTLKTPADQPTTAHLKVADSYLATLTPDQQKTLNAFEPINGVLRKLSDPDLRKLFLDLPIPEKPVAGASGKN
ncbi:dermonecrotic toxin domain-containing protein [Pseudomonas sp. P1.31]|uniref:dermonecrotic toxin domain-containing protein n=1 Tax=Pseudomonas sp. P1.31 TaxID=1699311 RepID=UPI00069E2A25|nr:DUF6543 domain-containing protein [Pseudomonas sp. P1.31]